MLDKQVRLGRPINIEGLAESVNGPAFSVCAGLVQLTYNERSEAVFPMAVGQWLRVVTWHQCLREVG